MADFFELDCTGNAGNTGLQDCVENFGYWERIILCAGDFEIATIALATTESTWTTAFNAIKSDRIYPFPLSHNREPDQEDRVIEEGTGGKTETVREGKDRITFILENISLYNHEQLRTHNNRSNLAVYIDTSQGYRLGTSEDGVKFQPLDLNDFYVEKRTITEGDTIDRTPVFIEFKDAKQWNDRGRWIKPTAFDPLLQVGVKDVKLSGTLGATGGTITVQGASDGEAIVGLVSANFRLYDDAAPDTPIAVTAADNSDGTYTCSWAVISGAHTLTLFEQPIGTAGYEASPLAFGKISQSV